MRTVMVMFILLALLGTVSAVQAEEGKQSEAVVEKMAFKFTRGITNVGTCFIELPKQTYVTIRDEGAVGIAVGPLKGIGMTVYRAFSGVVETVLFMVPAPGYYDPMIDPAFVWQGWEPKNKQKHPALEEKGEGAVPAEKKGE